MGDAQIPVGIELIKTADAEPGIGGIIEVLFDEGLIIGFEEIDIGEIGARLKPGAKGRDRNAIGAYKAFRTEAATFGGCSGARHIVDIPALIVDIADYAHGKLVCDRKVEYRFDRLAKLACCHAR